MTSTIAIDALSLVTAGPPADDGEGGGFSIATAMILRTDAGRRRWSSFAAIFRTIISHYPCACCE
jgi:hypothetical protein